MDSCVCLSNVRQSARSICYVKEIQLWETGICASQSGIFSAQIQMYVHKCTVWACVWDIGMFTCKPWNGAMNTSIYTYIS